MPARCLAASTSPTSLRIRPSSASTSVATSAMAAREGEQLEHDGHELRVVAHRALQRGDELVDDLVGALGALQALAQERQPQRRVAADDLGEHPLLGAEVVVQQAARDAGLARDVVERRAGRAAARHGRAHRVHDPLRLLPLDGTRRRGGLHRADPTRAAPAAAAAAATTKGARGRPSQNVSVRPAAASGLGVRLQLLDGLLGLRDGLLGLGRGLLAGAGASCTGLGAGSGGAVVET